MKILKLQQKFFNVKLIGKLPTRQTHINILREQNEVLKFAIADKIQQNQSSCLKTDITTKKDTTYLMVMLENSDGIVYSLGNCSLSNDYIS